MPQSMGATPPPMPQSQLFYLSVGGQQYGPCDVNSIVQMLQSGQINAQTMAWCEGMASWSPIATIPTFANLFQTPQGGMTPPPMPNM
jgi:hypothetical protein